MKLYRSFLTVGGLTLLSRILGFLRDILAAAVLGTGFVADAFYVAFRFPNLFRRLFGEGAFNSAFVPLYAAKLEGEGREAAQKFASEAMTGLSFVLILLSVIAILGMPWLMYLLAPGFSETAEKFELAVHLTQITFPYLLCMSLVALMSGILNTIGKFVESSSVSIVLNTVLSIAMLITIWLDLRGEPSAGYVQAWGVFAAGLLQLVLLMWGLKRNNLVLKFTKQLWTKDIKKLLMLGIPGVISGGITQINIAIGTMIASLQEGAVSHLYYADRLYELPLAIVGIAIGVVLLPDVSRHLRAGNQAAVMDSQNRSFEFAMLLTLPASVALFVIPREIVGILFERGVFTGQDTVYTAEALRLFALGLPAFVLIKVFSPAYFARQDTKTPMTYAGWSLTANTIGSVFLFFMFRSLGWLPHLGIAVATTLGGWMNALLLYKGLKDKKYYILDERLKRALPRIIVSSLMMGVVLYFSTSVVMQFIQNIPMTSLNFFALVVLVGAGMLFYFLAILVTGAASVQQLRSIVKRM